MKAKTIHNGLIELKFRRIDNKIYQELPFVCIIFVPISKTLMTRVFHDCLRNKPETFL